MHLSNSQQTSLRMGYIYEKDIYTNQIFRIYGVLILGVMLKDNPSPDPAQCGKPTALGTPLLILGVISSPNHLAPAMI